MSVCWSIVAGADLDAGDPLWRLQLYAVKGAVMLQFHRSVDESILIAEIRLDSAQVFIYARPPVSEASSVKVLGPDEPKLYSESLRNA